MSLMHEFIITDKKDYDLYINNFNIDLYDENKIVSIHDDIIDYLKDFLKCIPNVMYQNKKTGNGLDFYGVNLIGNEGVTYLNKVISSWKKILSSYPFNIIVLTGRYYEDGINNSRGFEKISLVKKEIIHTFNRFICILNIIKNNKDLYLLHIGI